MGGIYGGDPEGMKRLANLFQKHGQELDQIIRDLNTNTQSSHSIWQGPGANRFREAWSQAKPSFDKMVTAFQDAHKDINSRAEGFRNVGK
jgi:WXG100 family type VII secretion target